MFVLLVCCLVAALCYLYIFWYKNLPVNRIGKFPTPPGKFLVGHTFYVNTSRKQLPYFHKHLLENDGFIKILIGLKLIFIVSNYNFLEWLLNSTTLIQKPKEYLYLEPWVGQGLILSTGAHWKKHRKILTPAFHFNMLEYHISTLHISFQNLLKELKKNIQKDSVNVHPIIASYALDLVLESILATSVTATSNDKAEYLKAVNEQLRIILERIFHPLKMFDFFFKFSQDYKISNQTINVLHNFNKSIIKQRRRILEQKENEISYEVDGKKKNPFLDLLLTAKDEKGEPLTDQEIEDEVNTFIFAGYETVASATSFALYNLANNPDVQNKAFEEQKSIFGTEVNPTITYANLNGMKYLEMVIKEGLRLYPTAPLIGRKIHEDTYYDGKLLPKGLTIFMDYQSLHRNPKYFPEPDKFDPSRFETTILPFSFLPFSAGPRSCIGQKLAMIQIKQTISNILRNFELLPAIPEHKLDLVLEGTIKSASGVHIKFQERKY